MQSNTNSSSSSSNNTTLSSKLTNNNQNGQGTTSTPNNNTSNSSTSLNTSTNNTTNTTATTSNSNSNPIIPSSSNTAGIINSFSDKNEQKHQIRSLSHIVKWILTYQPYDPQPAIYEFFAALNGNEQPSNTSTSTSTSTNSMPIWNKERAVRWIAWSLRPQTPLDTSLFQPEASLLGTNHRTPNSSNNGNANGNGNQKSNSDQFYSSNGPPLINRISMSNMIIQAYLYPQIFHQKYGNISSYPNCIYSIPKASLEGPILATLNTLNPMQQQQLFNSTRLLQQCNLNLLYTSNNNNNSGGGGGGGGVDQILQLFINLVVTEKFQLNNSSISSTGSGGGLGGGSGGGFFTEQSIGLQSNQSTSSSSQSTSNNSNNSGSAAVALALSQIKASITNVIGSGESSNNNSNSFFSAKGWTLSSFILLIETLLPWNNNNSNSASNVDHVIPQVKQSIYESLIRIYPMARHLITPYLLKVVIVDSNQVPTDMPSPINGIVEETDEKIPFDLFRTIISSILAVKGYQFEMNQLHNAINGNPGFAMTTSSTTSKATLLENDDGGVSSDSFMLQELTDQFKYWCRLKSSEGNSAFISFLDENRTCFKQRIALHLIIGDHTNSNKKSATTSDSSPSPSFIEKERKWKEHWIQFIK